MENSFKKRAYDEYTNKRQSLIDFFPIFLLTIKEEMN